MENNLLPNYNINFIEQNNTPTINNLTLNIQQDYEFQPIKEQLIDLYFIEQIKENNFKW